MMRICYIIEAGSIHAQRWVNYFARSGHEIHLISLRGNPSDYEPGVEFHLMPTIAPRLWAVGKYLNALLWAIQTRKLVREIKPDVIDAHYITLNGYLAIASGFHPLTLTAWGSDVLITPKRNPLHRILTRYCLKKADLVVCRSPSLKEELTRLGALKDKVHIILIGVNTNKFALSQRDRKLKPSLGISGSTPIIISTRSLNPIYNVETLIKAVPLVRDKIPEAKFIIAGDGSQRSYLQNLVTSLHIENNVNFVGLVPHDDLPRYLASSDVYVSTSLSDGTSNSLLEAMACELAPVVTDLPASREWVTDGENGFLVPINDIQMLADRIVYLLNDGEVRDRFGKKGREIIKEKAEYETEMRKMEQLYQELANTEHRL